MSRCEENIFGMIRKQDWLQVGLDVTRPNDPIDQVFGDVKTDNLIAYWESMAAEYGIPVMAQFHAFDVESQKTIRRPVDVHNIEKGLIKVKIDQSERLRALMGRGVTNEGTLYNKVLNDGYNLAEEVFTRSKVAKNELLATILKDAGIAPADALMVGDATTDRDAAAYAGTLFYGVGDLLKGGDHPWGADLTGLSAFIAERV